MIPNHIKRYITTKKCAISIRHVLLQNTTTAQKWQKGMPCRMLSDSTHCKTSKQGGLLTWMTTTIISIVQLEYTVEFRVCSEILY